MGSISILFPNKAVEIKKFSGAGIQTQGCWVGSRNSSSVHRSPPAWNYVIRTINRLKLTQVLWSCPSGFCCLFCRLRVWKSLPSWSAKYSHFIWKGLTQFNSIKFKLYSFLHCSIFVPLMNIFYVIWPFAEARLLKQWQSWGVFNTEIDTLYWNAYYSNFFSLGRFSWLDWVRFG